MKTSELIGPALDWAVAKCERHDMNYFQVVDAYQPSTDWAQGGAIIEREKIAIKENGYGYWFAKAEESKWVRGTTPLIAAMRCYVASKLGDEIDLPEELK